jgi:hypothetical protein
LKTIFHVPTVLAAMTLLASPGLAQDPDPI